MKFAISIDDGRRLDLRIAEVLESWGLKGIFFIPTDRTDLTTEEIRQLSLKHEIGAHTVTHPMDMKLLSDEDLKYELEESKTVLEAIIGKPVTAFCYPRGRFDERVKRAVKDAGYEWARTTRVLVSERPEDKFETDTAVHFLPSRTEYEGRALTELVIDGIKLAKTQPLGYFHLWMHSKEIEELDLWKELNQCLFLLKNHEAIHT